MRAFNIESTTISYLLKSIGITFFISQIGEKSIPIILRVGMFSTYLDNLAICVLPCFELIDS